jgi:hypothetical protein
MSRAIEYRTVWVRRCLLLIIDKVNARESREHRREGQ